MTDDSRGVQYKCSHCAAAYNPKRSDRVTFCSRKCSFAAKAEAAAMRRNSKPKPKCVVCGHHFVGRANAAYCSDTCFKAVARNKSKAHSQKKAAHRLVPRGCAECGVSFTPEYGQKRRAFCSRACSRKSMRRTGNQVRRARESMAPAEPVNAIAVMQRDGWACWVCGCATPRHLRGTTEPNAPELDHVVALAEGGHHTYGNTRCACRACNHARGIETAGRLRTAA